MGHQGHHVKQRKKRGAEAPKRRRPSTAHWIRRMRRTASTQVPSHPRALLLRPRLAQQQQRHQRQHQRHGASPRRQWHRLCRGVHRRSRRQGLPCRLRPSPLWQVQVMQQEDLALEQEDPRVWPSQGQSLQQPSRRVGPHSLGPPWAGRNGRVLPRPQRPLPLALASLLLPLLLQLVLTVQRPSPKLPHSRQLRGWPQR